MSPLIESLRAIADERRELALTLQQRTARYAARVWSPEGERRYRMALEVEREAWSREQDARAALIRAQMSMVLPQNFS